MAKVKIELWAYKCERCGHEWIPREKKEEEPRVCPKCKSPYWNRPRRSDKLSKKGKKGSKNDS
ncbi:MAG: hypothetical protein ACM3SR_10670 [Ignavibacteriales bacterium]